MSANGVYTALSGAISSAQNLDVVANNLANVNTNGFKGDRTAFREQVLTAGGPAPAVDIHVNVDQIRMDGRAGTLRTTNNPLDVALQGDGYFTVRTEAGDRYTRAGSFILDHDGVLRTKTGDVVANRDGHDIRIPPNTREITIGEDGSIRADANEVGKLDIRELDVTEAQKEGGVLLSALAGVTPREARNAAVVQGYLETSNVNAVGGMNELVSATRSYETFQRLIHTFREVEGTSAKEIGRRA